MKEKYYSVNVEKNPSSNPRDVRHSRVFVFSFSFREGANKSETGKMKIIIRDKSGYMECLSDVKLPTMFTKNVVKL